MIARLAGPALALALAGCTGPTAAGQLFVDMKFLDTPDQGDWRERASMRYPMDVAVIYGARLSYSRPPDVVRAAEIPKGGDPRLLLRASRALSPGTRLVFLATAQQPAPGGVADVPVYQLALECDPTPIDTPGDLKGCAGYFVRVTRQWPAEIYEVAKATVTLIPEGGIARGRMRVDSKADKQQVKLDGEFTATVAEVGVVGPPLVEAK